MADGSLPSYLQSASPVPAANRAPWFKNTAQSYAGIFLWIAFYDKIAGNEAGPGDIGYVRSWGLLGRACGGRAAELCPVLLRARHAGHEDGAAAVHRRHEHVRHERRVLSARHLHGDIADRLVQRGDVLRGQACVVWFRHGRPGNRNIRAGRPV